MAEPLPAKPPALTEIIAAGWLRYVDGDLHTGAAQALLVRGGGRECESAGTAGNHDNALLLEYQAAPEAGRVWLCLDCVLDALESGEFTSLEWTHKVWGQLIPTEWRV